MLICFYTYLIFVNKFCLYSIILLFGCYAYEVINVKLSIDEIENRK